MEHTVVLSLFTRNFLEVSFSEMVYSLYEHHSIFVSGFQLILDKPRNHSSESIFEDIGKSLLYFSVVWFFGGMIFSYVRFPQVKRPYTEIHRTFTVRRKTKEKKKPRTGRATTRTETLRRIHSSRLSG